MCGAESREARDLAQDLGCQTAVQKLVLNHSPKVSATAREVLGLLQK